MTVHSRNHLRILYYQNQLHCHTHRTLHHQKMYHCQQHPRSRRTLYLLLNRTLHSHHLSSLLHFRLRHIPHYLLIQIPAPVQRLLQQLLPLRPVLQLLPQPDVLPLLLLQFSQLPVSGFQLSVLLTGLHIL